MKVIVSHDVDHLFWSEHIGKDLYITKLWGRSLKLMLQGVIGPKTFTSRINFWRDKRINRLDELMAFEKSMNIPATYFFVMRAGLGVAYDKKKVKPFIDKVMQNGFHTGVHGMAFDNLAAMKEEHQSFRELTGLENFGVRMHYLRHDATTQENLESIGYTFDSTDYKISEPYSIGKMIEFPIAVMDAYAVRPGHKDMTIAKAYTLERLEAAERNRVKYFTINFHDLVFDNAYALYRDWFIWLIDICKERNYPFTTFETALKEIYADKAIHG